MEGGEGGEEGDESFDGGCGMWVCSSSQRLMSTSSSQARWHNSDVDEVCDTQILFTTPPPVRRASLLVALEMVYGLINGSCDNCSNRSCVSVLGGEGDGGKIWLKSFGDGVEV